VPQANPSGQGQKPPAKRRKNAPSTKDGGGEGDGATNISGSNDDFPRTLVSADGIQWKPLADG